MFYGGYMGKVLRVNLTTKSPLTGAVGMSLYCGVC